MTIRPLSRDEVRSIDARAAEELGMPTLILMENAGRGAAAWLRSRPRAGHSAPGPDPLRAGQQRRRRRRGRPPPRLLGLSVRVVWFAGGRPAPGRRGRPVPDPATGRASTRRAGTGPTRRPDGSTPCLRGADWVVDALLGTGLTRPVEGTLARRSSRR